MTNPIPATNDSDNGMKCMQSHHRQPRDFFSGYCKLIERYQRAYCDGFPVVIVIIHYTSVHKGELIHEEHIVIHAQISQDSACIHLAQLVEYRSIVQEVHGSSPGRTFTQGLKIIEEKVLAL